MYYDSKPAWLPDYLILREPQSALNFVFAGVPKSILRHIHHLRIQFDFAYDPSSPKHEAYLIALRIILRILPNLDDLVLLWAGVPARVFDGVTFSLEALTCTMQCDSEAIEFLEHQTELRLVELPRWSAQSVLDAGSLSPDSLPGLAELSVPPEAALRVIPGRPVRSVDIRVTPGEGVRDWDLMTRALSESARPVDDLAIATLDTFSPNILRALIHIPTLRTLYLRVYSPADSSLDIFQWGIWAPYLSLLPQLETIKVEIDCRYMEPSANARFAIPTAKSVHRWSQTCPHLAAVYVGLYAGDALVIWER